MAASSCHPGLLPLASRARSHTNAAVTQPVITAYSHLGVNKVDTGESMLASLPLSSHLTIEANATHRRSEKSLRGSGNAFV